MEREHTEAKERSLRHWQSQPELNASNPAHSVSELDKTTKSFRKTMQVVTPTPSIPSLPPLLLPCIAQKGEEGEATSGFSAIRVAATWPSSSS